MDASLNNVTDTNNPFATTNGAGDFLGQKNTTDTNILSQNPFALNIGDNFGNKCHDNKSEDLSSSNDFFDRTTNGKRHATDEFDDDDDFGPETDVDAVDDAILSPTSPKNFADGLSNNNITFTEKSVFNDNFMDQFLKKDTEEKAEETESEKDEKAEKGMECLSDSDFSALPTQTDQQDTNKFITDDAPAVNARDETPTPPAESVHETSALVDNVADSGEDSEDEWNYFKGDTAEKKNIKTTEAEEELLADLNDDSDTMSQLNPNAAEFVPVSPKRNVASPQFQNLINDPIIAQSPKKGSQSETDISVPNIQEFEKEIKSRPSDLSTNGHTDESHGVSSQQIMENLLNGRSIDDIEFQPSTPKKTFNPEEFHFGPNNTPFTPGRLLDQSEVSTKANFGDETSASYMEDKDLEVDLESNISSEQATAKKEDFDVEVLNKVQVLPETVEELENIMNSSVFNDTISDLPDHDPANWDKEIVPITTDLDSPSNIISNGSPLGKEEIKVSNEPAIDVLKPETNPQTVDVSSESFNKVNEQSSFAFESFKSSDNAEGTIQFLISLDGSGDSGDHIIPASPVSQTELEPNEIKPLLPEQQSATPVVPSFEFDELSKQLETSKLPDVCQETVEERTEFELDENVSSAVKPASPLPLSPSPEIDIKSPLPEESKSQEVEESKSLEVEEKRTESAAKSPVFGEIENRSEPELASDALEFENQHLEPTELNLAVKSPTSELDVKSPEPEVVSWELPKSPEPEFSQLAKSPVAKTPEPDLTQLSKLSESLEIETPKTSVNIEESEKLNERESLTEDVTSSVKDEISSPTSTTSPIEAEETKSSKHFDTESVATTEINSFLNRTGFSDVTSPLSPETEILTSHYVQPEYAEKTIMSPSEESKADIVTEDLTKTETKLEEIIEKQEKEDKQEKEEKSTTAAVVAGAVAAATAATAAAVVVAPKKETPEVKPAAKKTPAKIGGTTTKTTPGRTPLSKTTTTSKSPAPPKSATTPSKSSTAAPSAANRTTPKLHLATSRTPTSTTGARSSLGTKPKTATPQLPKSADKKPLTNGECKTVSDKKSPEKKTTTTTVSARLLNKTPTRSTAAPPAKATMSVAKSTTGNTAASRPATAPARPAVPKTTALNKTTTTTKTLGSSARTTTTATSTVSKNSVTTTKTTRTISAAPTKAVTGAPTTAAPKPKPPTTVPGRARVPLTKTLTKSSPDTEKQLKETANKKITAAAAARVPPIKKNTANSLPKTAVKVSTSKSHEVTKTTNVKSTVGGTKKPTEIVHNVNSKVKATTTTTKPSKIEQNGIVTEVQEIATINVSSSNNSEPQLIKDLSPIHDNNAQLLDNAKILELTEN